MGNGKIHHSLRIHTSLRFFVSRVLCTALAKQHEAFSSGEGFLIFANGVDIHKIAIAKHVHQRHIFPSEFTMSTDCHFVFKKNWEHSGLKRKRCQHWNSLVDLGPHSLNFSAQKFSWSLGHVLSQTCYGSLSIRRLPRSNHLKPNGAQHWRSGVDSLIPFKKTPPSRCPVLFCSFESRVPGGWPKLTKKGARSSTPRDMSRWSCWSTCADSRNFGIILRCKLNNFQDQNLWFF